MCGRFTLSKEETELEERFGASFEGEAVERKYNIPPTAKVPVITMDEPDRIQMMRWGLIPSWTKELPIKYNTFNARVEDILTKPSWRGLVGKKRCLILADGYYEWVVYNKTEKQPYRITIKNEEPFAFAGLWDEWKDAEGKAIRSCTIITLAAEGEMLDYHNRIPAILFKEEESKWLDINVAKTDVPNILKPYPFELLNVYPVSKEVGKAGNEFKELLLPIESN